MTPRADSFVELGLNKAYSPDALLPHLERLLDLLSDALIDPEDPTDRDPFLSTVADYREALHGGSQARINECGETLLVACGRVLERHKKHRASLRAEIADLITLFREATTSVAGEGGAFAADMAEAAERFSALGQINDIRLLKNRLSREVTRLRDTAQAREQHWQAVVTSFKDKVEALEEQLLATEQEASVDALTGIANRRVFDRTLGALTKDNKRRFALVLVDVDDFKHINDERGHGAGDQVLQAIGRSFASSVRSDDLVARIGGDEFALILENATLAQAATRVTGIVELLVSATPIDGQPPATVSCGVAEFSAGDTPQSLKKRADEALYDAKRHGKGRVMSKSAPLIRDLRKK